MLNGAPSQFSIEAIPEIKIPPRVLMGAGPSASYPEALRAMGANTLGHLDPEFVEIMSNVGAMLRRVFKTQNPITGAITGSGTAGMEAGLHTVLVLSGITQRDDIASYPFRPNQVLNSVADLKNQI